MSKIVKFNIPDGKELNLEDIARILGKSINELPPELFEQISKGTKAIQNEKIAILPLINPFYDELMKDFDGNKKKISELVDIGKFIYWSARDIVLVEADERPDFIVEFQGKRIGIEHTQLFNRAQQHIIGKVTSLFNAAKLTIQQKNKTIKGLFNIFIDIEKISVNDKKFIDLSKIELRPFAKGLAVYIEKFQEGKSVEPPDFVKEVIYYEQETLHLSLSEEFLKCQLDTGALAQRIKEKEARIDYYKSNKNLLTCWLLIIYTSSISSSSFYINPDNLPTDKTLFDKVFLFDSFIGCIIEGKATAED